jgi:hypothetical protein
MFDILYHITNIVSKACLLTYTRACVVISVCVIYIRESLQSHLNVTYQVIYVNVTSYTRECNKLHM